MFVHGFISLQGSPRGLERKEAHPELDEPFHEAMILLDEVVEVFALTQCTGLGTIPSSCNWLKALGYAAFLSTVITRGGIV
jgi:hypothetical protein